MTIWLVRLAVLALLVTTLSVTCAYAAPVQHDHGIPAPICETIECDDLDEERLQGAPLVVDTILQRWVKPSHTVAMSQSLSPVILQPPEAA
jgi:hypothetical protein